jgi:glycosyltransferase involved in cell wall biosynthesis
VRRAGFACLIPAFNEAARIGSVLDAVRDHPLLDEIIVIDDGSSDGTGDVAQARGARVIRTDGNLGKTGALVRGLQAVSTCHVVLIDADLTGLTADAVTALVAPVLQGRAAASISLRGNAPRTWRWIGIDYISGERTIPVALLEGQEAALSGLPRFGFEVFLNDLLIGSGGPVAIVPWPDVASPSKASKRGLIAGLRADFMMMADIFRTVGPLRCLRQIVALRRLRVRA